MMFPGIRFARRASIHMCATRSPEISFSSGFGLDTRWGVWTAANNQASIKLRKEMLMHRKAAALEQVMPPCRRTKRRICGNSAVVVKEWFGLGNPKPYFKNLPSRWAKLIGTAGSCCGVLLGRRCPVRRFFLHPFKSLKIKRHGESRSTNLSPGYALPNTRSGLPLRGMVPLAKSQLNSDCIIYVRLFHPRT